MRRIARDVRQSLQDNSNAYGYSIAITGSYAVLSALDQKPTMLAIFAGAASAALSFAALEIATGMIIDDRKQIDAPDGNKFLARALNVVSVVGGMAGAALCGHFLSGLLCWIAAGSVTTVFFVLLDSVELRLAEMLKTSVKSPARKS